ncbi:MAG: M60 family metallopeptidase [Mangrovibacterium sp.]
MKMDVTERICRKGIIILMAIISFTAMASCTKEDLTPEEKPGTFEISDSNKSVIFAAATSVQSIGIKTTVEDIKVESSQSWCTPIFYPAAKKIEFEVADNASLDQREAIVKVSHNGVSEEIKITQFGINPAIIIESDTIITTFEEKKVTLEVFSNVDLVAESKVSWFTKAAELKAITVNPVKRTFDFNLAALPNEELSRKGLVLIKQVDGDLSDTIVIKQQVLEIGDDYTPGKSDVFEKDKKLTIVSATLDPSEKYQNNQGIDKSFDGDLTTLYHSPWSGMPEQPTITLEYDLDPTDSDIMNYMILYPRSSGANGIFKDATIWVTTEDNSTYQKVFDYWASVTTTPQVVEFATPIVKPRRIKIEVTDSYTHDAGKYYVSLAEIECYESRTFSSLEGDLAYFTDATFSELKEGVGIEDVLNIKNAFIKNIATYLLAGEYPTEYRVQEYEAYRPVDELKAELKTSGYNQFENPTGMYFEEGEDVVVFVEQGIGEQVALRVRDFGEGQQDYSYKLGEGANVLTMKGKGNGYVDYYTSNWETAPDAKIHFASGKVNGYYDIALHSNDDGAVILDNAVSEILDIKGQYVNLAYDVNSLKDNAYKELKDLTIMYDSIVGSQFTIMGLRKYNRVPKNHMFGRVMWDGFMSAGGLGAQFNVSTLKNLANPTNLRTEIWGPAHEFGHVNQVRPGMKWVGTAECTNNIYSSWIQYCYSPENLRLEHEKLGGLIGGRFNAYFNNGLVSGQEWGLQGGPDAAYGPDADGKWGGDHFVKLCPLWQLQLYYHVAGEGNSWHHPYFWADIFEVVRNTDDSSMSHGELQVFFVKNMCDAVQEDLTDFFIKVGMLKEVDKYFGDYSSAQKTITKDMVDDMVSYASKYPKPDTDVIYYITGNSIDAFKNQKKVTGTFGSGITGTSTKVISHSTWKNVVVFETYAGDDITHIAMVGTGSETRTTTTVSYPAGSTKIMAVSYDGTRTLVFGE